MLRRRYQVRLHLDVKSGPGVFAQLFPPVRSFPQTLGMSANMIIKRRMLKRNEMHAVYAQRKGECTCKSFIDGFALKVVTSAPPPDVRRGSASPAILESVSGLCPRFGLCPSVYRP